MYSCLERSVLRVKSGRSSHHEALDLTDVGSKEFQEYFKEVVCVHQGCLKDRNRGMNSNNSVKPNLG